MFAKTIIDSDAFLDMPMSSQCLYFHLSMRADDDGFLNNPKKIQRMVGASEDDLRILIAKNFLIPFESGVVVIKHWKIHNYIRSDRYKPTVYTEEAALLAEKDNGAYTLGIPVGIPDDNQMETQVRLGKDSTGKDRIGKDRKVEVAHARGEYGWVKLTDDQYANLQKKLGQEELDRCIKYVDEAAQKTRNKNKWTDWNLVVQHCHRDGWGRGEKKQKKYVTANEYKAPEGKSAEEIYALVDQI